MAFVALSGFPSSGKTTVVDKLVLDFQARMAQESYAGPQLEIVIIRDDLGPEGRDTYLESKSEKLVRASLLTTVVRTLSKRRIVICDGMNYIKGYRYQMNCAAKEASVRFCTVCPGLIHVATPPAICKEWNAKRPTSEAYSDVCVDALIMRYEEPSSMARWDSPLFTVGWQDEQLPLDDIWASLMSSAKIKANPSVIPNGETAPDTLQVMHSTTSGLISNLLAHLSHSPLSPHLPLSPPFPSSGLHLPQRTISLSEMQRLKRQFENISLKGFKNGGQGVHRANWTPAEWAEAWVRFLESQWGTG